MANIETLNLWNGFCFRFFGNACLGTPEDCGKVASAFLQDLKQIDPLFSKWYLSGNSKGGVSGRRVSSQAKRLTALFAENGMRDDFMQPCPECGYSLCLYNKEPDGSLAYLEFMRLGGEATEGVLGVANRVFLYLPLCGATARRIFQRPALLEIAKLFVSHFKFDKGALEFQGMRDLLPEDYRGARIGWLTYLSNQYVIPKLPKPYQSIPFEELGTFIWTTTSRFQMENEEHQRLYKQLFKLLQPQIEIDLRAIEKKLRRKS